VNQELERFEPTEEGGRIAYEHLHRYAICREQVAGQRVLDVACGAGYGTNILAQVAAEATGLDIDAAAVRKAKRKYRRSNIKFVAGDCYDMPFEAGSFDVVVANEMIEHIDDHDRFIDEVKRVLRPGGSLLVSTPNKPVYNRYKEPNVFHVSEMDIPEFRDLLEHYFEHVRFIGLRMALVSAGYDLDRNDQASNLAAAKTFKGVRLDQDRPEISNDDLALEDPEYVLAICSDRAIEKASSSSTIFFSSESDLWLEHERIMSWASQIHGEDEALRSDLSRVRSELENARAAVEQASQNNANAGHLEIASRLLSRLTGTQVESESASMIEAMFALNEKLIVQRAQLETMSEVQARASLLETELKSALLSQEGLKGDVRRAELRIDELRRDHDQACEDRDRIAQELNISRNEIENLKSEALAIKSVTEAHTALLESELKEAEAEAALLKSGLKEAESQSAQFEAELKKSRLEALEFKRQLIPRQEGPASAPSPPAQVRRQERLNWSHRQVQQQLARSRDVVRGSIPPAIPTRQSVFKRLTGARAIHRTRVFDRGWIKRQMPNAGRISVAEFLSDTRFHRIDPHPLFAASRYLDRNPDVAQAGHSPLKHYLEHGWREGRDPHPYFANDWYLQQYPDVVQAGVNPLEHYLEHGWKEGRRPNPVFDPAAYLSRHPDVRAAGVEPLTHFVTYGRSEARDVPFEGLDRDWRTLTHDSRADSLMDLLLSDTVASQAGELRIQEDAQGTSWPPPPISDFWLPEALREFMLRRNWEGQIPLFTYLYSVMDAYAEDADGFPASEACRRLLERARMLAGDHAEKNEGQPRASVIIPVYNNLLDTLLCIVTLLETDPNDSFEIIVADDCSTDATAALVPQIGGAVRHLRQPRNLGFLANCNAAAEHACGDVVIFLNNDTLILPGWLEGLVEPFDRFERVGLVGSKLINWDGRLQEAGGILWKDGSAWNFGRGQDPVSPEFNYLKDVDYCSGASIALPADLWRDLGGFDEAFSPAYCEDSDIAFRIRDRGFRTLYSPRSEVIHHEGRSHGRDTGTGVKAYQVANSERLFDRWRGVLEGHYPNGEQVLRARDRSLGKPHILVIDHYVPQPDKDAGSRTMFQFLEALVASGWAVTFWPENLHYDPDYTPLVQGLGVEVIYGPTYTGKFAEFLRSRRGLYDAALLSRPHVAIHFVDDLRKLTDARILYYGHDVHFERMRAQREVAQSTIEEDSVNAMKKLETGLCGKCDVILYPSADEAKLMGSLVPKKVKSTSIPAYRFNESDLDSAEQALERVPRSPEQPVRLLFVGGFAHGPNVDGIVWFCREVVPILRSKGFEFVLQIAGSNPMSAVWDLEEEGIHVLGFVSDDRLRALYQDADVVIAPLRFGAGVKGKVVEAMANGSPVVTTRVGAQGLAGADDYLFLGDTAEEFGSAVLAAADSEAARSKAKAAIEYVRVHYSRSAMLDVLRKVLPSVASVSRAA